MMNPDTAPAVTVAPLETRAEWRASDIADRSQWTYRLTDGDVALRGGYAVFERNE